MNQRVTDWACLVEHVREQCELTELQYPTDVVLALIHVESAGDDWAHRPKSAYHGILQIARGYMADAFFSNDVNPRDLLGDAALSFETFFRYMERYKDRHGNDPDIIAAMHKGGCGTAKTVFALVEAGVPIDNAIKQASEKHGVPRTPEYVRRFRAALEKYRG